MTKITNYDAFDYDYTKYWDKRAYENKAEKIILEKYLKEEKCDYFVDIGGSFGRNLEIYYPLNETPIILDYSAKTLKRNYKKIKRRYPKTRFIAANAYHLPFKKNSIGSSLVIRVLHHIENQKGLFTEIERVLKNDGLFILEFPNKLHIKAVIKWIFSFKFQNFSTLPYQQPTKGSFEGAGLGEKSIFLNYHPKYIKRLLKKSGFKIIKSTNCSFLRVNFLKKYLPITVLIAIERFLQKTISWKNIAPSIILKTKKIRKTEEKIYKNFEDILCCPKCKKELRFEGKRAICKNCEKSFKKDGEIWDFRI